MRLQRHAFFEALFLGDHAELDALIGLQADNQLVRDIGAVAEDIMWQALVLNHNLSDFLGQPLPSPKVERNARPAPVIDMSFDGDVGLRITRVHFTPVLVEVPGNSRTPNPTVDVLPSNHFLINRLRVDSSKCSDDFHFFVSNALSF